MEEIEKTEKTTVLYVEDDAGLARLLQKKMRRIGYRIEIAESGERAIEAFDENKHDAIIIDYNLGEMNGIEVMNVLSSRVTLPPVIMLTGVGNEKIAVDAMKVGASDYIVKDVDQRYFDLIPSIISSALYKRDLLRQNEKQQKQLEYYADELEKRNDELKKLAYYDPLTGLVNRSVFYHNLDHMVEHARRNNERLAVMYVDMDKFKPVNDTYGHAAGDELLVQFAARLKDMLRTSDIIARLGGDEFAIIMQGFSDDKDCATVAQKINIETARPFMLDGDVEVSVSASIGIATFSQHAKDTGELVRNADAALYKSKEEGRNCFHYYSEEMDRDARRRLMLDNDLRAAVESEGNGGFELYYQPLYDTKTRRVTGAEALIRWNHPKLGLVSPADFIPAAEKSNLIFPLGGWVIEEACRQCNIWRQSGIDIQVSVNISPKQFHDSKFIEKIKEALTSQGLPAQNLCIEITESTLIDNVDQCRAIIEQLRDMGVSISIDDFGTGYSSLAQLKNFFVNTLKVDKVFVDEITIKSVDRSIAEFIIRLGHTMDMKVVAEGVETQEQFNELQSLNCDMMQGYFFSRPVPAQEFLASLQPT